MKSQCVEHTPLGRLGTPEDIARIIKFLCSEESGWITGQTLIADGGLSLR
jgi:NAD(P)-dependent dehydrogenase (short-subunit alcohol dehydrogenase family)